MKKFVVLFVMAAVAFATSASAEQYVTGKVGAYFPEEDNAFDTGFNLEAAYGRTITEMGPGVVNAELGIGYYMPGEKIDGFDLYVIPVTLTAIYSMPFQNTPFEFYGGAGLGVYYWDAEMEIDFGFGTVTAEDDGFEFGVNLVGGALYNLNEKFGISAELEYDIVSEDIGGLFLNAGVKYRF